MFIVEPHNQNLPLLEEKAHSCAAFHTAQVMVVVDLSLVEEVFPVRVELFDRLDPFHDVDDVFERLAFEFVGRVVENAILRRSILGGKLRLYFSIGLGLEFGLWFSWFWILARFLDLLLCLRHLAFRLRLDHREDWIWFRLVQFIVVFFEENICVTLHYEIIISRSQSRESLKTAKSLREI